MPKFTKKENTSAKYYPQILHRTSRIRGWFAWDYAGRNILHTQGAAACIALQSQPCRTWARCGDDRGYAINQEYPREDFTAGCRPDYGIARMGITTEMPFSEATHDSHVERDASK